VNAETLVLAKTVVSLCQDPAYSPDQAAERVVVLLQQVEKAALEGLVKPMRELGLARDQSVSLSYGPYGWTCEVTRPDLEVVAMTRSNPAAAVQAALDAVEQKRPTWGMVKEVLV
jgi:hypothetical protein